MPYLPLENSAELFYTVDDHTDPWSSPQTVLFIHGFTESTQAWRCWIPSFSRHYQVVRYDQRGFGLSTPMEASFDYSTELLVDDLLNLIQHLDISDPIHIIAGKSGGICALELALRRPDLVASISMISPAIKAPETPGWIEQMTTHGMESWARGSMVERFGSKMPLAGLEFWVKLMGATALSTALSYLRWVANIDCTPMLKDIRCPVLIVGNEASRRGSKQFQSYVDLLPNGQLVMLEVDGYHTAAVAPDESAQAILKFLERLHA